MNTFLKGFLKTTLWTITLTILPVMLITIGGDVYHYVISKNTQFHGLFWAYPLSLMILLFTLPFAIFVYMINWLADRKKNHT
ncbi:hypothetical protein ACI2JA_04230 [Alkalihalobacillus sp. NPDC078783]